jgi:hypothetical protein
MGVASRCSALLLALAPVSPALPQEQPPACKACADEGLVACRKCRRERCSSQRGFLFCSAATECAACGGTQLEDCRRCDGPPAFELAGRRARLAEWREGMGAIDAFMDRDLVHAESERFVLTFDIRRLDVKGGETRHGGLHLYLDRLEAFHEDFRGDLSATDEDFRAKTHVFLWSHEAAQRKASLEYTQQPSSTESKLMGARPVVSIFYDKGHLHEEFELHQAVIHQTAHCLLSNVFDGIWPGNIRGGWIDEGLAHYYENAYFGEVRHYCYVESDSIVYFKFGRWEPSVRAAVDKDEALSFLGVSSRNTVDMTPEERMFAWSFVDYVLRAHPGRFGALARAVKQKKPTAEVLAEALDTNAFAFEQAWRAWVQETYSLKAKR